jgi:hypothetical protein
VWSITQLHEANTYHLHTYLRTYLLTALHFLVGLWPPFQLLNPIHSRYDSLDGGSARHKATQQHTRNKRTQTSMPRVRFEPTTPVFERAKTVQALDRAATVIGNSSKLTKLKIDFVPIQQIVCKAGNEIMEKSNFIPGVYLVPYNFWHNLRNNGRYC